MMRIQGQEVGAEVVAIRAAWLVCHYLVLPLDSQAEAVVGQAEGIVVAASVLLPSV